MATTERHIRSYLDGEVSLRLPTPEIRVPISDRSRPGRQHTQLHLIACSRCLRVLRDQQWVRAETVIRDLHTFDHDVPPRFEPVLCPLCTFSIRLRRAEARVSAQKQRARQRPPRPPRGVPASL